MVAVICTLMMLLADPAAAVTDGRQPDPGRISWSVTPADISGPDGRRTVDRELEPGTTVTEHVAVRNFSAQPVTFSITANDGYLTERGSFDMRPLSVPPKDGGRWITVRTQVEVPSDSTVVVPVDIAVPADATPGDHPAGVAASIMTADNSVRVENRVGVRFNLRVPGQLVAAIQTHLLDTSYESSWNPVAPGAVVVTYEVVNTGNVAATVTSMISASSLGLTQTQTQASERELLPGDRFQTTQRLPGVWPLGPVNVEVDPVPQVDQPAGGPPVATSSSPASSTIAALPISQLIAMGLAALVVWGFRRWRRRRRAALTRLLDQARAEGASSALHPDGAQL